MTKRFDRGAEIIQELYGDFGSAFFEDLEEVAPDFGRFIVEFSYGDVFSRPGLDMRTREVAIIGALTALGTAERQLKAHILGAIKVGATRNEIVEAMMQVAVYAGFPAGFNALMVAKRAFEELDHNTDSRYADE
ncbi:MAG: carboxymuconolactone decarboxylase family protein [Anaerolineales bacterium]